MQALPNFRAVPVLLWLFDSNHVEENAEELQHASRHHEQVEEGMHIPMLGAQTVQHSTHRVAVRNLSTKTRKPERRYV